jgi:ABC-type multidrug transport system fused ATPase/permease subunit
VLVLDDPLSAVNTHTEHVLVGGLRPAVDGRTVLIAAQRLSTIEIADRAAVLDGGRVVEHGKPLELLEQDGLFAKLFGDEILAA